MWPEGQKKKLKRPADENIVTPVVFWSSVSLTSSEVIKRCSRLPCCSRSGQGVAVLEEDEGVGEAAADQDFPVEVGPDAQADRNREIRKRSKIMFINQAAQLFQKDRPLYRYGKLFQFVEWSSFLEWRWRKLERNWDRTLPVLELSRLTVSISVRPLLPPIK